MHTNVYVSQQTKKKYTCVTMRITWWDVSHHPFTKHKKKKKDIKKKRAKKNCFTIHFVLYCVLQMQKLMVYFYTHNTRAYILISALDQCHRAPSLATKCCWCLALPTNETNISYILYYYTKKLASTQVRRRYWYIMVC